jgi:integrase
MQFWAKEEYLRFAEAVADKPLSHALFEVLYWGGLREGEALALLPGDIDFVAGAISVSKTFQVVEGKEVTQ